MESENDFRVDLHCINPGQTTVSLRMEITDHRYTQAHLQALLQDDVTFEVRNTKNSAVFQINFKGMVSTRSFEGSIDVSLPTSSQVYHLFCQSAGQLSNVFDLGPLSYLEH